MQDVDVLVVGGGVCGVLAGRRFAREGWTYKIIEKNTDYGGVWAYRANNYSHLQVSSNSGRPFNCCDSVSALNASNAVYSRDQKSLSQRA